MTVKTLNTEVQAILDGFVEDGCEIGVQAAAYHRGNLILDASAGVMDRGQCRRVEPESLFSIQSASKGVVATCVHMLVERRLLQLDAPVCEYWPEFAAQGKQGVTIRDVLTHRAGLPRNPKGYSHEMARDWAVMCARVAALTPAWAPGTQTGYHALNYGWVLGEVIRRVDGRLLDRFIREEVCEPLGLDGLFMGVPGGMDDRVATLTVEPPESLELPLGALVGEFNQPHIRACVVPAVGVFANARSLARHYALLAGGGVLDGVRLLRPETLAQATALQTDAVDAIYQAPIRKALGYWLGGPAMRPLANRPFAFGHPGLGGSLGFADPERELAFAFTKNSIRLQMKLDSAAQIIAAVYEHLVG